MWTYLPVAISICPITMTFLSTLSHLVSFAIVILISCIILLKCVCFLVTMPAWLFTLGSYILQRERHSHPYQNVVTSLVALTIPVGIGVLLQKFFPRIAKFCRRIWRILHFDDHLYRRVGIYANQFMFKL